MNVHICSHVESSYNKVAQEFATQVFNELQYKPLDRELLNRFAIRVKDIGLTCDIGCGPGQVARYLWEQGVRVCGLDLSPAMVEQARRLSPGIEFRTGNMLALDVASDSWAGITAFNSIIHLTRNEVAQALREFWRVLLPGGLLLLAFHLGDHTLHVDEWWGIPVNLEFIHFRSPEIADYLRLAGFEVEATFERPSYPDVERPTERAYVVARKPKGSASNQLQMIPHPPGKEGRQ